MNDLSRYPAVFPPPFADAWGDDRHGLWADLRLGEVDNLVQRMRWIEPGRFLMGSPENEAERLEMEGPRHEVTISRGFWLADTACTQALWLAVMGGKNPSEFADNLECPVEQIDWDQVQEFLSAMQRFLPGEVSAVLPSEAEWEYACRADTQTAFSFGDQVDTDLVNYDGNYPYAGGAKGEYREKTVPVKSLPPNPWGLFEIHGNVWEWCQDYLGAYSAEPAIDPRGDDRGSSRAVRGGSWGGDAWWARSAGRHDNERGLRGDLLGFRFALRSSEPGRGALK